ncbi:MAG: ClpXP protease specificity-enhancing factor [Janthinobacterium lividum]
MQETSTKPYLLRALYEWCTDNGYTPHIAVRVDNRTRVPTQFVRDGEIVLNISFDATTSLQMKNDWIEFNARFSGKSYRIEVPITNVLAIYARENGQGMAFPAEEHADDAHMATDVPGAEVLDDEEAPTTKAPVLAAVVDGKDGEPTVRPFEGASADAAIESAPTPDGDAPKGGRPHLKVVK